MLSETIFVCLLVFLAGFTDAIAGGGGLISLPAYVASGIPAHMALASNKFSSTIGTLVSSMRFLISKKVHYKSAFVSVICALLGSALGAKIVLLVNASAIKLLMIIVIPAIAVFVLKNKNVGAKNDIQSLSNIKICVLSSLIGGVIGFYDGFFGPGTGMFLMLAFTALLRLDIVTASGNAKIINLASNVGALITFLINGQVYFAIAIPAAVAGIIGNFIGSGLAVKNGAKVIRPIMLVVMSLLIIRIIYDVFA